MVLYILIIVFWVSTAAILHSYLFYPLMTRLLASGRRYKHFTYNKEDDLPAVSVLVPAYNEETVIGEKLQSVFSNAYPQHKVEVLVGSDASTDRTDGIVKQLQLSNKNLSLMSLGGRTGKSGVVNVLAAKARGEILVITDANVMPDANCLFEMVKHFRAGEIGLVDTHMQHRGMRREGISTAEKTYIESEVHVKQAESLLWGSMMGPFGGCFAVRKNLFSPIPPNFLVDDFYLNMNVLEQKSKAINELNAVVYEDISHDLKEEFRRKVRIATGNFQNLFHFFPLLFRFNGMSFAFFSHKVLRWLGPLFMIAAFISCYFIALTYTVGIFFISVFSEPSGSEALVAYFYCYFFLLMCALLLLPLLDLLLKLLKINIAFLRLFTHFFSMNLALLIGLFRFIGGVHSGIWDPTRRNQ